MNVIYVAKNQLPVIQDLAYLIWPSAYGSILSEAQMNYMLDNFYSIPVLESLLLEQNQIFLLLQEEEKYLGFCSYELNYNNTGGTKLHKLYIRQDIQGKGAGKFLLQCVEDITLQNKGKMVLLNVNRYNPALRFYEKMGYTIQEMVDIEIGNGYLMEDYIMIKPLI